MESSDVRPENVDQEAIFWMNAGLQNQTTAPDLRTAERKKAE